MSRRLSGSGPPTTPTSSPHMSCGMPGNVKTAPRARRRRAAASASAVAAEAARPARARRREPRGDGGVLLGEVGEGLAADGTVDVGVAELLARGGIVEPVGVLGGDARADAGVVDDHVEHDAKPGGVE